MRGTWPKHERRWSWITYIFLLYIVFLFPQPIAAHAGWRMWGGTIAAVAIFLPLYFIAWSRRSSREGRWATVCILALGYVLLPLNNGAFVFLIYAAALFGFVFLPRVALAAIAACAAAAAVESWFLHISPYYWGSMLLIIVIIGTANLYAASEMRANAKLRLAQEEVEHLAKVAERERIARDMHDVLGHTLSVIVLKSELAAKLVDHDAARAQKEIGEVEQIAREALAEVRHAIRGYRAGSLAEEFARARATLETAGIEVSCESGESRGDGRKLSAAQETVLALVMREAVTNVVRHSGARTCRIVFEQGGQNYRVAVEDDGRGGARLEGNGLRGMRERVEALGGTLTRDGSRGTRLSATIPQRGKREAIA